MSRACSWIRPRRAVDGQHQAFGAHFGVRIIDDAAVDADRAAAHQRIAFAARPEALGEKRLRDPHAVSGAVRAARRGCRPPARRGRRCARDAPDSNSPTTGRPTPSRSFSLRGRDAGHAARDAGRRARAVEHDAVARHAEVAARPRQRDHRGRRRGRRRRGARRAGGRCCDERGNGER